MKICDSFTISTSLDNLYPESQQMTGNLVVYVNQQPFPDSLWNDFVLIVLSWWMKSVLNIIVGEREQEELLFMDGPFKLLLNKIDAEYIKLSMLNNSDIVGHHIICTNDLVTELLRNSNYIIRHCMKKGFTSDDLSTLENDYRLLQNEMKIGEN